MTGLGEGRRCLVAWMFRRAAALLFAVLAASAACIAISGAAKIEAGDASNIVPAADRVAAPRLPQIWFGGNDPVARSARGWPANDYMRMFDPAASSEWANVARHMSVFKIAMHGMRHPGDEELSRIIATLNRLGIAIALSPGMVLHDNTCGGGEGYAPDPNFHMKQALRIKRLGGVVQYIQMDEPLIRGHLLSNLGKNRVGCHYSIPELALHVKDSVAAIRSVFPDVRIGETEAFNTTATGTGTEWADTIKEWSTAFAAVTGKPLAFSMVAINWRQPGWEAGATAWYRYAKSQGIPFGIVYNGVGGNSDESWTANAIAHFTDIEKRLGIMPDLAGFYSWNEWPVYNLPETRPGTLTNVALEYLRFRGVGD